MTKDRPRYLGTIKSMILQGMIKLLEPTLQIKCRKEDVADIKKLTKDLETEFHNFMSEKTGREYNCSLVVLEDNFLTDEKDEGCGGVVLYTADSCIVCPNTIVARLNLAFEEMLP